MRNKLTREVTLIEDTSSAIDQVIDLANFGKFSIGVEYSTNVGETTMTLSGGLDDREPNNFSVIPASVQGLDNTGGYHVWNIPDDFCFKFLKLNVPATASTTVKLQGVYLRGQ